MQTRAIAASWVTIGAIGLGAILSGCNDDSGSGNSPGTIGFSEGPGVSVRLGSFHQVVLSLQNSSGVIGQKVRLASSDAGIADVTPASCTLSSSSAASSKCTVKIHGKVKGQAILVAQADGYPDTPLNATVGDAIAYGTLEVANDAGAFVTTSPLSVSVNTSGPAPYTKTLTAEISGSSGITSATGAYINFSSTQGSVIFNPPQCQVTTASPQCATTVSLPTASTPILVQVVGAVSAQNPGYSSIVVNAGSSAGGSNGTIALSTQSGNNVPNGMKAPLFVNWTGPTTPDTVTLTLTISGPGVSFYSYAAGTNTNITTSTTQTCTLIYGAATNTLNCGLGLVGQAASGSVTVSAVAMSAQNNQYTIANLTLGAVAPEATRRSVTFTNNSSKTIYVGITGGAASSWLNATTPAVPPGTTVANMKPGAGSACGPSNPQAACPIGSTCLQGGATPQATTPFYCYYDQNAPASGYQIATGGAQTVLDISGSSLSPNDIIWSGNFYGRTGCNTATGACENATCVGTAGGLACGAGTGPHPGTNTLAELTFQAYPATDFYDVSIINGANFAVQFGPTSIPVSTTNGYSCGTAGSLTASNGGYSSGSASFAGLPASPWTVNITNASFPPGVTTTGDASSYFKVVIPSTGLPGTSCTSSSTCTTAPDTTCGYAMANLDATFTFATRTCGKPVAYLTADSIWGFNQTSTNAAPFAYASNWNWSDPNTGTSGNVTVGNLQLCNSSTYSAYTTNGTTTSVPAFPIQPLVLACGGVMWGATESPGPLQNPVGNVGLNLTPPSQQVQTANTNWLTNVLPTIKWLKQACPTCYTYPFDDMTSTFTCSDTARTTNPSTSYGVTFSDLLVPLN